MLEANAAVPERGGLDARDVERELDLVLRGDRKSAKETPMPSV